MMTSVLDLIWGLGYFALVSLAIIIAILLTLVLAMRLRKCIKRRSSAKSRTQVAFFHPYANSGGGGEMVLWQAVRALQRARPDCDINIYTGDQESDEEILARTRNRFNLTLTGPVRFVRLKRRWLLEAKNYPRFTMLGQSLGSMILAWEALWLMTPDVFIDTTGWAFTFPVARLCGGCKVGAYVHYPTISSDMLKLVYERRPAHNNAAGLATSRVGAFLKLVYYHFFAFCYGCVGRAADVVMANSTWTGNHMRELWGKFQTVQVLFPPVSVSAFQDMPLTQRRPLVVSIGQYRPEKAQHLQIEAMKILLDSDPQYFKDAQLVLIGSCRHADDEAIADALEAQALRLGIADHVSVRRNVPYTELKRCLSVASGGLHTMWNEHFGIGVVEMQASGAIAIAHNTAGPKLDIVVPSYDVKLPPTHPTNQAATGFLATSAEEYAAAMATVLRMPEADAVRLRTNARHHAKRKFSDQIFGNKFVNIVKVLLD